MHDRIEAQPVPHRTCSSGGNFEQAMRAHRKLGLGTDGDPHLARSDAAQPRLVGFGFKPQLVARLDRVDAEGYVVADRYGASLGAGSGEVRFRESDCCGTA